MARIFVYDGREIDDPNPEMSVEEVREYLSHFYPELNNATTNDRSKDGDQIYEFRRRVGVKGTLTPGTIMDILASTPELQLDIITMAQDGNRPRRRHRLPRHGPRPTPTRTRPRPARRPRPGRQRQLQKPPADLRRQPMTHATVSLRVHRLTPLAAAAQAATRNTLIPTTLLHHLQNDSSRIRFEYMVKTELPHLAAQILASHRRGRPGPTPWDWP